MVTFSWSECNEFKPGTTEGPKAAVAEWSRYRIVTQLVTSSSPVPLESRRVGQRCTLNLPRAQTSSRWCVFYQVFVNCLPPQKRDAKEEKEKEKSKKKKDSLYLPIDSKKDSRSFRSIRRWTSLQNYSDITALN
ncbi:hypothetical protein TNCV_518851 [Trichonephila clavipes]|nr:hypothetical protein TNCV_518851 [Trichonephila clavipes]